MKAGNGSRQLKAEDAALLNAFAAMQGITPADLIQLAMSTLAAQLRVQVPHCGQCPLMHSHQQIPVPDNVVLAQFS